MAQIVPRSSGFEALGQGFGSSLSTGLQEIANRKLLALQQRHGQEKSAKALGAFLDPAEAQAISQFPEKMQGQLLLAYLQRGGGKKDQTQEPQLSKQETTLQQLLGQIGPQGKPGQIVPGQLTDIMQNAIGKTRVVPPTLQQQAPIPQQAKQSGKSVASILGQPTTKEQRILDYQNKKLALQEQGIEKKERQAAFKETKEERKAIIEKAKSARQNLHDLERLEELDQEGKLDTPGYVEFLKRSGFDIPALMNPGSEEYQKIAQTFLRDAKTYLGSRISNFELEQFLKTIPSLSQSPEGRKRVIANLKYFQRSSLEYNDALKEVLKENKGTPPLDLSEQIDDKVGKKLDKVAKQFKKDLEKPVPAGQNKYITALQAGLGSAAGSIPGLLKSGAKGAVLGGLAGSTVGGVGAIPGALGGAALGALGGL